MNKEEEENLNRTLAEWIRPYPQCRIGVVDLGLSKEAPLNGSIEVESLYTQEAKDYINSKEEGLGDIKEVGQYYFWEFLPIFTYSFDACITHLVTKLRKNKNYIDINLRAFHPEMGDPYIFTIRMGYGYPRIRPWQGGANTPSLAACLAFEKFINEIEK